MDELKDMIAVLKQKDFVPSDVDTDLHKKVMEGRPIRELRSRLVNLGDNRVILA